MDKLLNEMLEILADFGGGRDNPTDNVVRFLLPSVFWAVLIFIAFRQWRSNRDRRDLYIGTAALVGIARELMTFVSEYGGWKGFLSFDVAFRFYPPFEHVFTMTSCLLLGYAFMKYFLPWRKFTQAFFISGSVMIVMLYMITAPTWIVYLRAHPQTLFGAFWGDMAFRITASLLLATVLGFLTLGRRQRIPVPKVLFLAFTFLFLDEFLMIINLATGEQYRTVYAPIRHNLHIWAIPLFLMVYWTELYERLIKTERLRENMFNLSPSMLCVSDLSGAIKMASPASRRIFGYEPERLVGKRLKDFGFPEGMEKKMFAKRGEDEGPVDGSFESTYRTETGEEKYLQWNTQTVHAEGLLYSVVTDITDPMKMREELLKAEKLDSVALLAGGIAHDFNNIMTAIVGNISIAMMNAPRDAISFERLTLAEKACKRATDLTRQLLTFTKGGSPLKKTVILNDLIKETCLFSLRGSNVRCEFLLSDKLWPVEIDEGQISQVIGNLTINAEHSMPDGGAIVVSAHNMDADAMTMLPLASGKYVVLSIKDTGVGIPREHIPKIFDPFFTTKEKGSGLGLATAYSIIKRHNGYIGVQSEPGSGTLFSIYLPASDGEAHAAASKKDGLLGGKGRVLVVDDEEVVHDTARHMLKFLGYEVSSSKDCEHALTLYEKAAASGTPFDAVIMDLTIPGGMGGKEAIKRLLKNDPHAKVIVSSGYSNDDVMAHYRDYGFKEVIAKPYKIETLDRVLHAVLTSGLRTE